MLKAFKRQSFSQSRMLRWRYSQVLWSSWCIWRPSWGESLHKTILRHCLDGYLRRLRRILVRQSAYYGQVICKLNFKKVTHSGFGCWAWVRAGVDGTWCGVLCTNIHQLVLGNLSWIQTIRTCDCTWQATQELVSERKLFTKALMVTL